MEKCSIHFIIRETSVMDVKPLVKFFSEQPSEAYTFFKPHGFDEKSVLKVLRNKAFMTFVVTEKGEEMARYLTSHSPRGVTILSVRGGYTFENKYKEMVQK